jgi:hypothetical protein
MTDRRLGSPVKEDARFSSRALRALEAPKDDWIVNRFFVYVQLFDWLLEGIMEDYGRRTALEDAPSCAKHLVSQMAACRQSSRCSGQLETLGMETNFESAYMRVSSFPAISIH